VEPAFFVPLLVIGLILLGLVAYLSWLAEKKRREALAALARVLGWSFHPDRDPYHDEEYEHFEIFRKGHSRHAFNTLVGNVEIDGRRYPAKAGDFRYKVTSGSGKNRRTSTYTFSYLIFHLPFQNTPNLLIRPEGMLDKLAGVFGFDDIDFESEEFSRRFHVQSSDRRFAYDVIHPRMMEFLLDVEAPIIDIENGRCCLSNGSARWKPEGFHHSIRFLQRFFDLWPDHLTAELERR